MKLRLETWHPKEIALDVGPVPFPWPFGCLCVPTDHAGYDFYNEQKEFCLGLTGDSGFVMCNISESEMRMYDELMWCINEKFEEASSIFRDAPIENWDDVRSLRSVVASAFSVDSWSGDLRFQATFDRVRQAVATIPRHLRQSCIVMNPFSQELEHRIDSIREELLQRGENLMTHASESEKRDPLFLRKIIKLNPYMIYRAQLTFAEGGEVAKEAILTMLSVNPSE